jgi:NitT/TauT family transport system substrate-binding protein
MTKHLLASFLIVLLLSGCEAEPPPSVEIGINPWPGYEFLYLAEKKGFFEEIGLNVKLLQLDSLADVQRAYINGYTDGLASTVIEAVQAQSLGGKPLKIVLIPDFSNGGDAILSRREFKTVADLKGKKIGAEVSSLGIFLLQRALLKAGLTLKDVTVINVEQLNAEQSLLNKRIDAVVSYPPTSVDILKHEAFHTIFTSAEIPGEIIDTISVSEEALAANPELASKLRIAWQMALDYFKESPEDASRIMAQREGISPQEFNDALTGLKILSSADQKALFENKAIHESVLEVCRTLVHIKSINEDCNDFPDIMY